MNKQSKKMNKQEKVKIKGFWLRLWQLLAPSQKQIKVLLGLTLVFELTRLAGPYLLKMIIDRITYFTAIDIAPIIYLIALMLLSEQIVSFIDYFKDKMTFKILVNIEYYLPVKAQKKLTFLSLSYHEKENTGNKIIKIERGTQKIMELAANLSWEVAPTILQLLITLIVLFIVDWRFGFTLIVFAPLFIWITYKVNKGLRPVREERHKNYEIASGKMGQSIININTVKSFAQEKREIKEFQAIRKMIKINELKEWFKILKVGLGRNLVIDLGRISILLLGVYLVWHGNVSIGTLVFVITLSEKSYFSLYRLSRFYDKMEEGKEAVNRFANLLDQEQDIVNPKNGIKPKDIVGKIEFKNVNFSYESDSGKALSNVNVKINPGCVTALVGPSGGGKTTVARMIYRHYDPQKGEVLLDRKNLKDYNLYAFRKFIAIVPQEVEIFNKSARDNIAYANPKASFQEIKAAARIANAEEFIEKLSKGYDTEVGERGIKLSGGQRQRVGIARAILANPRILIFDEATSSLDSYSEKLIQDAIDKIGKGRTMIIIAHRLSTIKKADKIIVLEEGKVVEQGSHYELSKAGGGLYAKLLKLQEMGDVA
ncbi:MAG: ABC transporter ATP-binding protein [Patescibacteria group bacterium]|nr:ABC transporter ATP-binding protein [Patescibacteria group bacterium]